MTIVTVAALLCSLRQILTRQSHRAPRGLFRWLRPSSGFAYGAAAALPALYFAQLAMLAREAVRDNTHERYAWMKALPLPIYDARNGSADYDALVSAASFTIGVSETLALLVIVLALQNGRVLRTRFIVGVCAILALLSLVCPVMSTSDPYEYVAAGMLKFAAYAPPAGAFDGTPYAAISAHIPLRGVIYGPLWLFLDSLQTAYGHSVYEKLEALRCANVLLIGAFIGILARSGVSRPALVALALNPVLWYYSVASPHADVDGLALLAVALYFARRSNALAAAAALACAGSIKLQFVIVGGAMLATLDGPLRRLVYWTAAITFVAALTYYTSDGNYAHDLTTFAAKKAAASDSHLWIVTSSLALLATFVVVACRKGLSGLALLFHQAGPIAAPWYLYWGIPYALALGSGEFYFVALPLAATMLDDAFKSDLTAKWLLLAAGALLIEYAGFRQRAAERRMATGGDLHLVAM